MKWRGRNVAFHHLLLINLTTVESSLSLRAFKGRVKTWTITNTIRPAGTFCDRGAVYK